MRAKALLAAAVFTGGLIATSGTTWAGEVIGPPGTPNVAGSGSGIATGARLNSNSLCSYNGLNDMIPTQGQISEIVQTPANQGDPGDAGHGTCRGGTNHNRDK